MSWVAVAIGGSALLSAGMEASSGSNQSGATEQAVNAEESMSKNAEEADLYMFSTQWNALLPFLNEQTDLLPYGAAAQEAQLGAVPGLVAAGQSDLTTEGTMLQAATAAVTNPSSSPLALAEQQVQDAAVDNKYAAAGLTNSGAAMTSWMNTNIMADNAASNEFTNLATAYNTKSNSELSYNPTLPNANALGYSTAGTTGTSLGNIESALGQDIASTIMGGAANTAASMGGAAGTLSSGAGNIALLNAISNNNNNSMPGSNGMFQGEVISPYLNSLTE